ncbi:hypothetical protein Nepgr_013839 [Nepenthes gracilis]|uniref:Uncharacterized protein n=1 Tax=Nepenthes gracilis TaxID=150966 RepID=A0AAD3XPB6_NEPGR|nr:hypothetical protein Nepgr_013839 [Nepenthes gracilis]
MEKTESCTKVEHLDKLKHIRVLAENERKKVLRNYNEVQIRDRRLQEEDEHIQLHAEPYLQKFKKKRRGFTALAVESYGRRFTRVPRNVFTNVPSSARNTLEDLEMMLNLQPKGILFYSLRKYVHQ